MFEQEYRRRFDGIRPDPALVAETKRRMSAAGAGAGRRPRRLTRRAAVALAVCAALVITAAAAGSAIWQAIQDDLGDRAPYATEVLGSCEDQGIRIEVQAALADTRLVRIYFTARDLVGNRLDKNTQVTCSLSPTDKGTWPYRNYHVTQLSYDPEAQTALFVLTATGREGVSNGDTFCLNVESLLGGHRFADLWISNRALDSQTKAPQITGELLPSTQTEGGVTVLLPQPEREQTIHPNQDYHIVAAGFAADGNLHVRVRPAADTVWEDVDVSAMILKDDGAAAGHTLEKVTPVDGDLDYCLEDFGPDQLPLLTEITVMGDYSILTKPVEGDWALEILLQSVEKETIPLSLELPAAQAAAGFVTAEQLELSPLSLTLVCDQDTMYLQDGKTLRYAALEQLTPFVTLTDGTMLTPSYADSDSWWACWIFAEPIDPEDVVSVTLNGHTISLDNS